MKKGLRWKVIVTLAVIGLCVFLFTPLNQKIKLGLDLKGGIHLLLQVKTDDALSAETDQEIGRFSELFKKNSVTFAAGVKERPGRFSFTGTDANQEGKIKELADQYTRDWTVSFMSDKATFSLNPAAAQTLREMAVSQTLETIRNRIDQFGVAEPDIRRQEGNRIQVQLPGMSDPNRAIAVIGKTAHLEFKLVDDTVDPASLQQGLVGPGREIVPLKQRGPNNTTKDVPIVLKKDAVMTGEYITDARATIEQNNNQFSVSLTFNVLRAGALPAPVNVLEQRTVGPTLGQESIDAGIMATGIAAIAIMLFMALYYGVAGLFADTVLLLNIVLTLAGLAAFGATLTLPGIAGIILTIAMAVDANVLIYERIREELRHGLKPAEAVHKGYDRATLAILDSNTTNVLVAIILYQFGTGPIRGFAVTLVLGIIMSMFTAIFVSRIMFDIYLSKRPADATVSI